MFIGNKMDTWILPKQLHTLACALDTEALSLDSNEQSQICAQSLFVRSKPSPLRIWLRKWKRDSWTRHLSGRILRPSLGERFVTAWTSSLGDILASPSAQPVSAKESKTRGISGRGLQMAFDFSDLGSASLRTSKDISAWGCPTSSKTWQEWVIERRGAYSQRLKSAHRTNGSGCSSWPTAAARDFRDTGDLSKSDFRKDGKLRKDVLPRAVSLDQRGYYGPAVPASSSTDGSRRELWATTRAGMARGNKFTYDRGKGNIEEQAGASVQGGGKLNPRWVETLMGLPVGWTMPSCASPVTIERMS